MKRIFLVLLVIALGSPFVLSFGNSDVVGIWNCKTDTEQSLEFKLTFFEKDGRLYGKYNTENQEMILHYIRILNDRLRFQTETKGLKIKYSADVDGNKMSGTIKTKDLSLTFTGEKVVPPEQPKVSK